ncbi:MAG: prepilin peptidase [Acidobacteria bacterium]|nr:prepilin peptidase [Acidobacteriota bacterium]MCA1611733.1 prepilin peptidase [Acidobacteriota bacterium]
MTGPSELGPFLYLFAGAAGLLVGSFLNVLAHRLPRGESVVWPGSHCPACGAPITALQNIPVVSWIALRGKCAVCRAPIPLRYPALEIANAALWIGVALKARDWGGFLSGAFLTSACLALLAIDAEFQILPDKITLTGIAAGIGLAFLSPSRAPLSAVLGAALGAGGLFLVAFLYEKIAGHEGMGLGDVKMLGMIGAFLGPAGVLLTILLASLSGSVVGIALIAAGAGTRKLRLPFGVFLAIGAVAAYFFGAPLIARYREMWPQ